MSKGLQIAGVALIVILASCGNTGSDKEPTNKPEVAAAAEEAPLPEVAESGGGNVVEHINTADSLRTAIEMALESSEKVELSTEGLRSQIAQKWSMIHYYKTGEALVRIKTYPHEGVSNRTEEFYFDNGSLIMALIEDNGSGKRGKEKESIDKIYYFNGGEMIEEMHNTKEAEYSIRNSDGERLLQEAAEYLALMP